VNQHRLCGLEISAVNFGNTYIPVPYKDVPGFTKEISSFGKLQHSLAVSHLKESLQQIGKQSDVSPRQRTVIEHILRNMDDVLRYPQKALSSAREKAT